MRLTRHQGDDKVSGEQGEICRVHSEGGPVYETTQQGKKGVEAGLRKNKPKEKGAVMVQAFLSYSFYGTHMSLARPSRF